MESVSKKRKPAIAIIIFIALIVIGAAIAFFVNSTREKQLVGEFTEKLSGTSYNGFYSIETKNHGTAKYFYKLYLESDNTCRLDVRYSKSDDDSMFPTNKEDSFSFDDLTWSVRHDKNGYRVELSGNMSNRDYSAGNLNSTFNAYETDSGILLTATRGNETVCFNPYTE